MVTQQMNFNYCPLFPSNVSPCNQQPFLHKCRWRTLRLIVHSISKLTFQKVIVRSVVRNVPLSKLQLIGFIYWETLLRKEFAPLPLLCVFTNKGFLFCCDTCAVGDTFDFAQYTQRRRQLNYYLAGKTNSSKTLAVLGVRLLIAAFY